ncbi:hypothetical protein [Streptomyces sp. NPDC000961]|uniref:hypothetical protein n=1 Tax=Streptomyces sp. NPDC000961 TaxID=3364541 RepID=UPI00368CEC19
MSHLQPREGSQQPQPTPLSSALIPLLTLTFVLLVVTVGCGLAYVTLMHPAVAVPLTVATAGVTLIFAIVAAVITLCSIQRR